MTGTSGALQQQLTDLSASVSSGFENVTKTSAEYDETMRKNDKLLSDYLTKMSEFTKRANKELTRQVNTMTETANVVGANIRLAESSIDKQLRKLESAIDALNDSTTNTTTSVRGITNELAGLTNKFDNIKVNNSQIEIDGGYEGAESLTIIEAKNNIADDFIVRQLYYPYENGKIL